MIAWLIALIISKAEASPKLITSIGINKINVVDENLSVPSDINYSLSYGLINAKKGFSYSLTTNRGLEQVNKSTARINSNNGYATLKTRITSDVLTLGFNKKRSIYSVNLMNVKKISKLNETKQEKNAIMYGLSYSHILTKDIIVTATAIAPNHGMGVRSGGILTVGYIW
jgi:hypothetical protein